MNLSFAVIWGDDGRAGTGTSCASTIGTYRARDPLRARARPSHIRIARASTSPPRSSRPGTARRSSRARRSSTANRSALLRRLPDARAVRTSTHGSRTAAPTPSMRSAARVLARLSPRGPRLRPRRPGPRAAAHHGPPRDHAGHVQGRTPPNDRHASDDKYFLARLPAILEVIGIAAAIELPAAGDAATPGVLRLPPRQPQVGRPEGRRDAPGGVVWVSVLRLLRLRLVEARLSPLRRRLGSATSAAPGTDMDSGELWLRQDRVSSFAPTRTKRPSTTSPARLRTAELATAAAHARRSPTCTS